MTPLGGSLSDIHSANWLDSLARNGALLFSFLSLLPVAYTFCCSEEMRFVVFFSVFNLLDRVTEANTHTLVGEQKE
ncbi:hypothetical protein HDV63DRAFT_387734 [Trichoderma sp. SZMC 28014]